MCVFFWWLGTDGYVGGSREERARRRRRGVRKVGLGAGKVVEGCADWVVSRIEEVCKPEEEAYYGALMLVCDILLQRYVSFGAWRTELGSLLGLSTSNES